MQSDLTINGVAASTYGVLFEHPSLENLLSFANSKAAITNSSRHSDGVQMDARNAKVAAREVQLTMSITAQTEAQFLERHRALEVLLRTGDGSGIIKIGCGAFLWRLRFDSSDTLRIFAGNLGAKYVLTFTEPNPTNNLAE